MTEDHAMTLEEFYQEFEAAHKKYPMRILTEVDGRKILRHQIDDTAEDIAHCGYCPITAVAKVLADADSPLVRKTIPDIPDTESFSPSVADDWAYRLGLSDTHTQCIIIAADDETSAKDWEELHPSCSPKILASIKEIRERMISILHKENTP